MLYFYLFVEIYIKYNEALEVDETKLCSIRKRGRLDEPFICLSSGAIEMKLRCFATILVIYAHRNAISVLVLFVIMSHSLLWRRIVLLTVGVYSSNHRVLYIIGISMTRRFKKSVGPSVR